MKNTKQAHCTGHGCCNGCGPAGWLRLLPLPAALSLLLPARLPAKPLLPIPAAAMAPWFWQIPALRASSARSSPLLPLTRHVIDLTNIALLGADRKGEMILKGIEGETREYNGTDYTYYGPADCEVTENADGTVTYAINTAR